MLGRLPIAVAKPLETLERPPGGIASVAFPIVGAAMLVLSLRVSRDPGDRIRRSD